MRSTDGTLTGVTEGDYGDRGMTTPATAAPAADEGHDGIYVRGLTRSFGTVHAVAGMDVDARPGRVTALVGPNGSGKTTLMLMIAGLLAPDAGQLRVAGFDPVTQTAAVHARLGWMPDALGAWDALSAREHLTTYAAAYRVPRARIAARADELLQIVDLREWGDAPARVLSRGQKQRLGLARALIHDPDVLVLDEPASGLDPASRVALRQLLRRMAADGKAVLVSSHVLSDLDEMADDAVYVLGGRTVTAEGPSESGGRSFVWRIRSLDEPRLVSALRAREVLSVPATAGAGMEVSLTDEQGAARLLADLVGDGVPIVAFGPAGGRIEQTYLGLAAERANSLAQPKAAMPVPDASPGNGGHPAPPGTIDGWVDEA